MNTILRLVAGALLAAVVVPALVACADAPSSPYGAAPVISGTPPGYDTRKEEARGR
jgi:hypothetical protein